MAREGLCKEVMFELTFEDRAEVGKRCVWRGRWDEREKFSSRRRNKNKGLRENEPGPGEAGCGQGTRAVREEVRA